MTPEKHDFSLVADYFDDLLDPADRERAEAVIARAPSLVARVIRMREVLYRPAPVAPPSPELPTRIAARHRLGTRLLRYAIAFAAGVVIALLLNTSEVDTKPLPTRDDLSEKTVVERSTEPIIAVNRRIR